MRTTLTLLALLPFLSVASPITANAGTAYCFGDGSGTACPCGNVDPSGLGGCLHASSPVLGPGAVLSSSGTEIPTVADDTVMLTVTGLPPVTALLFFQGTATLGAGAGIVFGDGLRCAGGTIIRLKVKMSTGGTVSFPETGEPQLHIAGAIPGTSSTRYYQGWYRNPSPFCTPAFFNLSNGLQIDW